MMDQRRQVDRAVAIVKSDLIHGENRGWRRQLEHRSLLIRRKARAQRCLPAFRMNAIALAKLAVERPVCNGPVEIKQARNAGRRDPIGLDDSRYVVEKTKPRQQNHLGAGCKEKRAAHLKRRMHDAGPDQPMARTSPVRYGDAGEAFQNLELEAATTLGDVKSFSRLAVYDALLDQFSHSMAHGDPADIIEINEFAF